MPKLILGGITHELAEELITIGRAPDNLIQIEDPSVSSRHAELRADDKSYRLRDLGSTSGTRVNGNATTEIMLRHGDQIRFGGVQARYEIEMTMSATQPLPVAAKLEAKPAETSSRPVDFANASPFRARNNQRDPAKTALFMAAAIAFLALLGGLAAVLTIRAPTP